MKRTVFAVISAALLFSGCGESYPRMEQLPPEELAPRTSSTYTGTTVDFIYMSTRATPRIPTNELEMPDFPDFNGIDNPFDETFYDLFTNEMGESVTISFPEMSAINVPEAEYPDFSENASQSAPPTETADVRFTETSETAVTEVPRETVEIVTETVTVSSQLPETARTEDIENASMPSETPYESDRSSDTYPSSESFDIMEYMPSANDYPKYSDFDIKSYF
ncbi:MAG: hypothetical protein MSJ26_11550 [Oscillospiraceae bacterium]|nr:hypothetical protein [Oscillospiraceae bacterium]